MDLNAGNGLGGGGEVGDSREGEKDEVGKMCLENDVFIRHFLQCCSPTVYSMES